MKAANVIKVKHFWNPNPKHEGKQVLALCGHRVPKGETTDNKDSVNCFLCRSKLQDFEGVG